MKVTDRTTRRFLRFGAAALIASRLVQMLRRASFLLQLVLGLAIWADLLRGAIPLHIANGILFAVLLEVEAVAGAFAGVAGRLVALAAGWGILVVAFGLTQTEILVGDLHVIVQIAHLGVGLVAMGLAERVARATHARLLARSTRSAVSPRLRGAPSP